MEILKTYVTVIDGKKRVELKFIPHKTCEGVIPTQNEIEAKYIEVTKPVSEPNQCPMNNPKCPLYVKPVIGEIG